jgi:murein L,D-transpeptidase YafK
MIFCRTAPILTDWAGEKPTYLPITKEIKMRLITVFLCLSFLVIPPCHAEKLELLRKNTEPRVEKELRRMGLSLGSPVFFRVFKQEKVVEAWVQDKNAKTYSFYKQYPICVFSGTLGPKLQQGDLQSPEGFYDVTVERLHPESDYHLALNIGYPNAFDAARGRTGDFLMIHGGCESKGCFAMTDESMEELYLLAENALQAGQPKIDIHIFPFYMTRKNFDFHRKSTWLPFWRTLKPAYDAFQETRIPPEITVQYKNYRVKARYE